MPSILEARREASDFYREGLVRGVITTLDVLDEAICDGRIPHSAALVEWIRSARMNLEETNGA